MDSDERPNSAADAPIIVTNIKANIPHHPPDNIINSMSSVTSTPEKRLPTRIKVSGDIEQLADSGDDLHTPRSPDVPVQTLAWVNCSERIVICIDISSEMNDKRYRARAGNSFSGMEIVKRALKLFINNKQLVSNKTHKHAFALVLLLDEALWLSDFTTNVTDLFTQIDSLETLKQHNSTFNMSTLFDLLLDKAKLPLMSVVDNATPPYIVRVVLIYGRSHCMPISETHESQNLLSGSPCYFMDIVYLHEAPSESNQCEEIYMELCEMDTRGFSHVFDISKTPTKVFDAFGKLIAHPLQRPIQSQWGFKLEPVQVHVDPELM